MGISDARLLSPPHIFLSNILDQAHYFDTAQSWQVGVAGGSAPSPTFAVAIPIASSAGRVFAGLLLATLVAMIVGVAVRYFLFVERLVLPVVTLLAPVSPIAWLPVAIFLFGIGNRPAIFMVFIALVFTMTLSATNQIDNVNRNYINAARTMGATKRQIYLRVIIPAILPGLLMVLRLNLFGAWMVVLVAEATGVGLGQVMMLARNTFNPSLVFFTITLIGLLGFGCDLLLRTMQRRVLYWMPQSSGVLRGL